MNEDAPVLSLSQQACSLVGVPPTAAFALNLKFHGMVRTFNANAFGAHGRKYRKLGYHRTPLGFLDTERRQLNPKLGLFKTIHLLTSHIHAVVRRPKQARHLSSHIEKLIELARHYQGCRTRTVSPEEGAAMTQELEAYLKSVQGSYTQAILPIRVLYPNVTPFNASEARAPA